MAKKSKSAPGAGDDAIAASIDGALNPRKAEFPPPEGTRCMVTLPAGDIHLLDTACLVDGMDRSAVVSRLIREHLSKYFSGKHGAGAAVPAE